MFGKKFKVLKDIPNIYEKVGDNYPEYLWVYSERGMLKYEIIDDSFGQPSPANYHNGEYAKKLRKRSSDILQKLINEGYIELINSN